MSQTIVGRCLDRKHFQDFTYNHHYGDKLFADTHHATAGQELVPYLPGQLHLGQEVLEFQDRRTAFIALVISHKWQGTELKEELRIMYIHPELVPIFLQELGDKLYDKPIGDNEKNAPPPDEDEEDEDNGEE